MTLSLTSPWARRPFRDPAVRRAVEARIPDGYTLQVFCNSTGSAYGVRLIEWGETAYGNRVIWGDEGQRHYFADVHAGIDAALSWLAHREAVLSVRPW